MVKKFFMVVFALILIAGGYLYLLMKDKREIITPYPYQFTAEAAKAIAAEIPKAEAATILIVGDQMGEALNKYTPALSEELAKSFKNPPQIYNWSRPQEGLHRTLFKLKSLKRMPQIVIYHGGNSELHEQIFDIKDRNAILRNFDVYDNEKLISLIITFPILSKVFYHRMKYFDLGTIKDYQNQHDGTDKMKEKEISFKFFDYELRELVDLIKEKKSSLVFITTPINLEVPPKEVCSQSTTDTVIEVQQEIEDEIKNGNFKKAYSDALELSNETLVNAKSFYLLGKSAMGVGNLKAAREALGKAAIFDCMSWRGNSVYNSILKARAQKRQIPIIDFDQILTSQLSNDALYMDEVYPQNLFYEQMMGELKDLLKKLIIVND